MKSMFRIIIILGLLVVSQTGSILAQDYNIIESDNQHIILEFDYNNQFSVEDFYLNGIKFTKVLDVFTPVQTPGNPLLPTRFYNIGIPMNAKSVVRILEQELEVFPDKFVMSTPDSMNQPYELLKYNEDTYGTNSLFPLQVASINSEGIYRYIKLSSLLISPFQFNPVERTLLFSKRIKIRVDFISDNTFAGLIERVTDKNTLDYLSKYVVNPYQSENFISKTITVNDSPNEEYWYNPNKNYYKIFLNKKGVYRVTYDELIASGISPTVGIQDGKLELFNDGISLPLDIVDSQNDGFFNSGDYFQFVGKPATPHDQYTRMNIYNLTNVYWFSYQADTVNKYNYKSGSPQSYSPLITSSRKKIIWEEDNSYQHFGHAHTDQRDYWLWDYTESRANAPYHNFLYWIQDSIWNDFVIEKPQANIKVGLHGLSAVSCANGDGHNVNIKLNTKIIGTESWNGQESAQFEKPFYLAYNTNGGGDTVRLNWQDLQKFEIECNGNTCVENDFVLVNFFELEYWAWNKTYENHFTFLSPPNNFNDNYYYLWLWQRDNMKVFIPSRGEIIVDADIRNDIDHSVYFIDTINTQTEYYCVADDYFLTIDSITIDESSNLRNINIGADYIIITHKSFMLAAEQLAAFRENNLFGFENPRVKIIDIQDIYDEFSYGLLAPISLNNFVKYAFENWQSPAPQYVVLLGDMSFDYRKINSQSKDNFIPSIPYHVPTYGQAPSDNAIVTVVGDENDLIPDLAIGRISCESIEEANILVQKIVNYPGDQSKEWKQNVLLLSSGLSAEDENQLKFNDKNIILDNSYLKPLGIKGTKIFRYPNKPEYIPFQGEGPDIRREIDNGAVIANYYGHGGGQQWDLVFTNDDIIELNNGNKLPFISSITCYTAHYDNQEIFGEIFNSIPDKGSIAFWGSSGVTFWPTAANINQRMFYDIFYYEDYVIGNAINAAKSSQVAGSMTAVLTLLGDPALELALPHHPDFVLKQSNISFTPSNPIVTDSVNVKAFISNLGTTFVGDTVAVRLYEGIINDSTLINAQLLTSFGELDSTLFVWHPSTAGLTNLILTVNEDLNVTEDDLSDNSVIIPISVFDFGEPNIIKPIDGYSSNLNNVQFLISDIGFYFNRDFNYLIQISNSTEFIENNIVAQSSILKADDALVSWAPTNLSSGEYFWRAIIYDQVDTNYSQIRSISIVDSIGELGFSSYNRLLKRFLNSNINFSEQTNSLILNTSLKPPYPSPKFLIDSIYFQLPIDMTEPSMFTVDGTYFYFSNMLNFSGGLPSKIYKIGTGNNGTIAGEHYGSIEELEIMINGSILSYENSLFINTGDSNSLLRIDTETGDTARIIVPDSLLVTINTSTQIGGVYLYSDGDYVYNLGVGTNLYPSKFVLRKFDPMNNWLKVGEDIVFNGSIINRIASFIVAEGYLIVYENYNSYNLRRYRLSDGYFEEEWRYSTISKNFYCISYDAINNFVYFQTFKPGSLYAPAFFRYQGKYIEANGEIISPDIGPATHWGRLEYNIDQTNSNGVYKPYLYGRLKNNASWVLLDSLFSSNYDISNINPNQFNYLRVRFNLADSSYGAGESMKFRSLNLFYTPLAEVSIIPENMNFIPDTVLQGTPIDLNLSLKNIGYADIDSLKLDFYDDLSDSIFYSTTISLPLDTTIKVSKNIISDNLLYTAPISPINVTVTARSSTDEFYTFNNQTSGSFYVTRDSVRPNFTITFDGNELIDGDVISSKPEIIMTLTDNSPLPLSASCFEITHTINNVQTTLNIPSDVDSLIISAYPNSSAQIIWRPELEDGEHKLSIYTKDASLNPYSSTSLTYNFNVYNNPDLLQVYNYPNPFKDKTEFTFELRGIIPPEEVKIKVFTVAGRLIKEFIIPGSSLQIGFNRIAWDGKDQDGDEIANGVYFYKIISKHGDETKVTTQKLAKLK